MKIKFKNKVNKNARNNIKNNEKGITLIALVVTIIVLIILAGISISLILGNNGIITKARDAKKNENEAQTREKIQIAWDGVQIEGIPKGWDNETKTEALENELKKSDNNAKADLVETDIIKVKYKGYESTIDTKDGNIIISNVDVKKEEENKEYSSDGKTAIIPAGFTISDKEEEKSIDNGLVVKGPDGSEFVWIPINKETLSPEGTSNKEMAEKINGKWKGILYENYSSTSSDKMTYGNREPIYLNDSYSGDASPSNVLMFTEAELQTNYDKMINSIKTNGGFYVSRFEVSLNENGKIQSKSGTEPLTASSCNPYNWYGMYNTIKHYAGSNTNEYTISNGNVFSEMIYGSCYDAMLNWALFNGNDSRKVGERENGNHTGTIKNTGETVNDKINNIYDLEGNLREYTQEGNTSSSRMRRGGDYSYQGRPGDRGGQGPWAYENFSGSRITLFLENDHETEEKITHPEIKVGTTNIKNVTDLSTLYGEKTDFSSIKGIEWQLFYDDVDNIYLIASDYVPNFLLGSELVKPNYSNSSTDYIPFYGAEFTANSKNEIMENNIWKNGSKASTIRDNPLTGKYLKWIGSKFDTTESETNPNLKALAYMMDTNVWKKFAGSVEGAYAIGGPTLEIFVNSYNAKHDTKCGTYETIDETNANEYGYLSKIGTQDWSIFPDGLDNSSTNMWVITDNKKAYGMWIASPNGYTDRGSALCLYRCY